MVHLAEVSGEWWLGSKHSARDVVTATPQANVAVSVARSHWLGDKAVTGERIQANSGPGLLAGVPKDGDARWRAFRLALKSLGQSLSTLARFPLDGIAVREGSFSRSTASVIAG